MGDSWTSLFTHSCCCCSVVQWLRCVWLAFGSHGPRYAHMKQPKRFYLGILEYLPLSFSAPTSSLLTHGGISRKRSHYLADLHQDCEQQIKFSENNCLWLWKGVCVGRCRRLTCYQAPPGDQRLWLFSVAERYLERSFWSSRCIFEIRSVLLTK